MEIPAKENEKKYKIAIKMQDWEDMVEQKINLHDYEYILGPHLINKHHWVAVIINVKHNLFSLVDTYVFMFYVVEDHISLLLSIYAFFVKFN